MATDLSGPADTRMMRIVHTALRRDLARAQVALTELPLPDDVQRAALCAHLHWLMGWLHHHHETEDEHLYPLVRQVNPEAAGLLDEMDADHAAVQVAMTAVEDGITRYAAAPEAREDLLAALDALSDVLLPHLRREEDEAMPVVSATLTQRQWRDVDQEHNVRPLSPRELAFTGLWMVDELSPEDEAIVAAHVGPVPRWIIRNVLIHAYRRAMFACWRLPQHSPLKLKLSGHTVQYAEASPPTVWEILADVTRVGEWSHECHTATWIDGSEHAVVGARFRGSSRSGFARWSRACRIHLCEAPSQFGYRTEGRLFGDSTEWLWTLQPSGSGTRIEQHYRVRRLPIWADRLLWLLTPAHRDRRPALLTDLQRLATLAERTSPATDRAVPAA